MQLFDLFHSVETNPSICSEVMLNCWLTSKEDILFETLVRLGVMLVTPRLSEGIYFLEATISNSFTRKESVKEGFPENDLIRKNWLGKIKIMTMVKKQMKMVTKRKLFLDGRSR